MNLSEKAINYILDAKKFDKSSELVLAIVSTDVSKIGDHEILIYTNADSQDIAIMLEAASAQLPDINEAIELL